MRVNGEQLVYLSHEERGQGNSCVFSMTNRDIPTLDGNGRIQRDTLLIRRVLTLYKDNIYEQLEFTNYDVIDHEIEVTQLMTTAFDDIFEVRGVRRIQRGALEPALISEHGLVFEYRGLDGITRKTFIKTLRKSAEFDTDQGKAKIICKLIVPGKSRADLKTHISFDQPACDEFFKESFNTITVGEHLQAIESSTANAYLGELQLSSDNPLFDRILRNARLDIEMLTTQEKRQNLVYPYAGIPWFSAPFGRDGIITAYQTLPFYPRLASGVLDYVFALIGTQFDSFTDAEPGKIFHEMRRGEMANLREIPYIPYYGSVDSTPLALILLGEYIAWTHDFDKARKWWPQVKSAVEWIEKWGDFDQDGFLEYQKKSATGLDNQGWKDSHNSIMYANGDLATPPIQLCEVQAYAYRARTSIAMLSEILGQTDYAQSLREKAERLKDNFYTHFWDRDERYIYLARDGRKSPCQVMSSNQGHCLWGQILDQKEAKHIADHLMSSRLFSGYGIRTLAADEKSFNPLSYHNGSVWPHDNSLIAEGLRFYSHLSHLQRLIDSIFDVASASDDFRLPELFCGFRRRVNEPPIPYEVACRPQAWAAGSIFLMLKAALGLVMTLDQRDIIFQSPILPREVNTLSIDGIKIRDSEISAVVYRGNKTCHVEITKRSGPMRIMIQK